MNLGNVIRATQETLGVEVDGHAGPETWSALYQAVLGENIPASKAFSGHVDARSEKTIATLLPEVAPYARTLVLRAADIGIEAKIIGGTRTYDEQDALFAKGRTAPGPRVTNAKGGESNHNFGIAFDIGIFDGKAYLGESPAYHAVGAIGLDLGLEWGGSWTTFSDKPHFQLRPVWADQMSEREMLAELRNRVSNGTPIYA